MPRDPGTLAMQEFDVLFSILDLLHKNESEPSFFGWLFEMELIPALTIIICALALLFFVIERFYNSDVGAVFFEYLGYILQMFVLRPLNTCFKLKITVRQCNFIIISLLSISVLSMYIHIHYTIQIILLLISIICFFRHMNYLIDECS